MLEEQKVMIEMLITKYLFVVQTSKPMLTLINKDIKQKELHIVLKEGYKSL
jgi:hypothetical protein